MIPNTETLDTPRVATLGYFGPLANRSLPGCQHNLRGSGRSASALQRHGGRRGRLREHGARGLVAERALYPLEGHQVIVWLVLLMIENLHDLIYQNCRNDGINLSM